MVLVHFLVNGLPKGYQDDLWLASREPNSPSKPIIGFGGYDFKGLGNIVHVIFLRLVPNEEANGIAFVREDIIESSS